MNRAFGVRCFSTARTQAASAAVAGYAIWGSGPVPRLVALTAALALGGCHTDMWAQPQTRALEPNPLFAFAQSARPFPPGAEPFDADPLDDPFRTGLQDGEPLQTVPAAQAERALKLTTLRQLLDRGHERFDVFCSPCHGRLGDGEGMIAQRGLRLVRKPRNLHTPRIINAPDGHIFQVITHGYGAMYSYGDRIPAPDRWSIVAYLRALQLSQGANWRKELNARR